MRCRSIALALALTCAHTPAAAQAGTPTTQAPVIRPWRYDEDYGYLHGLLDEQRPWWAGAKQLELDARADLRLSVGLDLRARFEAAADRDLSPSPDNEPERRWLRALPYASLEIGPHLRAFAQLVVAYDLDQQSSPGPLDEDRGDLLQGFAELSLERAAHTSSLRLGRQMLAFGSERLISTRFGPNVPRAFDVARFVLERGSARLDVLAGWPVQVEPGAFDDAGSQDEGLWSLYSTTDPDAAGRAGLDLYYIGLAERLGTFDQGSAEHLRHTLGLRWFGDAGAWDWNVELMGQAGSFGAGDVLAGSVASDTGFTFAELRGSPRLGLKADLIGGDDDPGDPDLQTFDPLYPRGKYFGEAGLLGPYNLVDLHPSLELALGRGFSLGLGAVAYWRESTGDGVYDNGGNLLIPHSGSTARAIGTQFDLSLGLASGRSFETTLTWSSFRPGEFLEESGRGESVQVVTFELRFVF